MNDRFHWARLLAFVTGLINQELLLCNEYLAAENRILRAHLPSRLRLSDAERFTLAEIAKRLGRKALKDISLDLFGQRSQSSQRCGPLEFVPPARTRRSSTLAVGLARAAPQKDARPAHLYGAPGPVLAREGPTSPPSVALVRFEAANPAWQSPNTLGCDFNPAETPGARPHTESAHRHRISRGPRGLPRFRSGRTPLRVLA